MQAPSFSPLSLSPATSSLESVSKANKRPRLQIKLDVKIIKSSYINMAPKASGHAMLRQFALVNHFVMDTLEMSHGRTLRTFCHLDVHFWIQYYKSLRRLCFMYVNHYQRLCCVNRYGNHLKATSRQRNCTREIRYVGPHDRK